MKKNLFFIVLVFIGFALNAQNWTQQNTNMAGVSSGVDQVSVVDSNIVWVNGFNGSGAGPFLKAHSRTQDGGNTWLAGSYNGFGPNTKAFVLTGVDFDRAFCVALDTATSAPSFWKTVDGGANWTIVTGILNGGTTFADGVKFWDKQKGFCYGDPVSGEFDIYTTTDGGATWNDVPGANIPNPQSTSEYGYNGFDCTAIVPGGIGFFLTNMGRVYKTTDYGVNWEVTPTSPFAGMPNSGKIYASSENYIIISSLTDVNTGTWSWKYTTDGGTTWQTFAPAGNFYEYQMCYVPGSTNTFVATSPYTSQIVGVGYSDDGGLNWTDYLDTNYLQPAPFYVNVQCLGVGFYDLVTGWVGNYTQPFTYNSILKYHNPAASVDAGALTILQPATLTNIGSNVQVKVRVKNYGATPLTTFSIAYQVNSDAPVTVQWSGNLLPDSTLDYTFSTTYTGPDSAYTLCAYTSLTGDIHPLNDKTCKTVQTDVGINDGYSTGFSLDQNFPNPANGITTIGFAVPQSGEVALKLMNAMGKVVYTETRKADAGNNKITLNTKSFTAGVYFYEFDFNGKKLYRKMIIY